MSALLPSLFSHISVVECVRFLLVILLGSVRWGVTSNVPSSRDVLQVPFGFDHCLFTDSFAVVTR